MRNDVAVANIGPEGTKYFPFLGTVFFFILINNIIGTLPGGKPGTGTMGVTVALALVAFVMFNAAGMQKKGVGGYIKGIVPHGVPGRPVAGHLGHRGHLAARAARSRSRFVSSPTCMPGTSCSASSRF